MRLVDINQNENGSHSNQTINIDFIPEGYAVIPEDMETPNFPFGDIEVEEIDGVMTVTKWVAGEIPETEPIEKSITITERVEALEKAMLEMVLGGAE